MLKVLAVIKQEFNLISKKESLLTNTYNQQTRIFLQLATVAQNISLLTTPMYRLAL